MRIGVFMTILLLILFVAFLGAVGGVANCAIAGEFVLPHHDKTTGIWRPGWVGNVIVGAIAAICVWGLNGPLSSYDLFSVGSQNIPFTISQLVSSIVVGLGGGNILTQLAQKQAERITKDNLTAALQTMTASAPPAVPPPDSPAVPPPAAPTT